MLREFEITEDYVFVLGIEKHRLIDVFHAKDLKYIGGFGFDGQGPLDLEFDRINASGFNSSETELFINDMRYFRTIKLNGLADDIRKGTVKIEERITVPKRLIPFNNGFKFENTIYGTISDSPKHLVSLDPQKEDLTHWVDYPNLRPSLPSSTDYHLYWNNKATTNKGDKVAIAYMRFPLIRVYDFNSSTLKEINYKPKNEQVSNVMLGPNNVGISTRNMFSYYQSIKVSDNRVYALYLEGKRDIDSEGNAETETFNEPELHVYDWNGKPIKRIVLPEWVSRYDISPDDSFIYIFHPENENYLYRYSSKK